VSVVTQTPALGSGGVSGEASLCYSSPSYAWGSSLLLSYGGERWAWLLGGNGIRSSNMRPAGGLDSHAAVTRFLGLPSDVFGTRPSDTAFTQYGGRVHVSYLLSSNDHLAFSYTRSQQDAGKRYDQLLGGDGNLKADLRNLMLDFGYIRYLRTDAGWFDSVLATTSFNSQREERVNQGGQGDPLGTISTQFERTTVLGASVQAEKLLAYENRLLLGADFATEWVDAPAHVYDPRTGAVRPGRPRIPDGARYTWAGAFAQDGWETLAGKIRLTGAVRVGATNYHVDESPISSGGRPLFPADRLASVDFSARVGAVLRPTSQITIASSWARGYRAPSVTDLGTLGVTGDGYEISAPDVAGLGATVGSTAADDAQDTGIPVTQLGDQTSNSLDVGVRLRFDRWGANITAYRMVLDEVITKQALILPDGAVGVLLGSEPVVAQGPTGVVYVAASPAPVLVRENFGAAIYRGIESDLFVDVFEGLRLEGVFSMVRAEDSETALPPNIEGGVPPANGSLTLTWEPHPRLWLGGWALLADEQTRLSSLDLSDRRSGATRSRDSIAAFFDRGARVRGLVGAGPDGIAHTVDDVLNHTGETLADVQWRVLGSAQRAPLFAEIPGYGIFGARVGWRMAERHDLYVDFENLADKCYRGVAWGVDGRGRGVTVKYRWRF
jgi:hemoglobin/transferrin/lactoferrin receptor protein